AQLLDLLGDAARVRLRSDVPVGAYLSGGLDSSLVTALTMRYCGDRLRTFSVTFEDSNSMKAVIKTMSSTFSGPHTLPCTAPIKIFATYSRRSSGTPKKRFCAPRRRRFIYCRGTSATTDLKSY